MTKQYDTADHHPPDAGCKYADELLGYKSFCLSCPFVKCIFYTPRKASKARRDEEILNLIKQGMKEKEIAIRFGVHVRTVQRAIIRSNGEQLPGSTILE